MPDSWRFLPILVSPWPIVYCHWISWISQSFSIISLSLCSGIYTKRKHWVRSSFTHKYREDSLSLGLKKYISVLLVENLGFPPMLNSHLNKKKKKKLNCNWRILSKAWSWYLIYGQLAGYPGFIPCKQMAELSARGASLPNLQVRYHVK